MQPYSLFSYFFILIVFAYSTTSVKAQNKTEKKPLKIISWNIYMLPAVTALSKEVGKTQKLERAEGIVQFFKENEYDIIVWQEIFNPFARRKIKKGLDAIFPYQYGPANKAIFPRTNSGISIYSKLPLVFLEEIAYEAKAGVDAWAKKGALLMEGEWEGKTFQIVGTHLQAGAPNGNEIRKSQMEQIRDELLIPFQQENTIQIICGDMNTEKQSEQYKEMLEIFDVETYELGNSNGSTCRSDATDNEIDFIFIKGSKKLYKSISQNLVIPEIEWGSNGEKWLSDHHAIEAEIGL